MQFEDEELKKNNECIVTQAMSNIHTLDIQPKEDIMYPFIYICQISNLQNFYYYSFMFIFIYHPYIFLIIYNYIVIMFWNCIILENVPHQR